MRVRLVAAVCACALFASMAIAARADTVADFYRGKQIRFMIGAEAGSGYDDYARLLARHLGAFIPGKPTIIPENLPGAGGMIVANEAYNSAPRDGTFLFTLHFTLPLYQALGGKGVRFDARRFKSIGRLLASNVVIGVSSRSKSGVKNVADAKKIVTTIGSTGLTSNSTEYPEILNNLIGTKFKVVAGYRGEGDIFLAMERGEIDGFGSYSYLTFKSVRPDYLTKKLFYPIVQWGAKREKAWPDVPTAEDLATNATDKRAMDLASAGSDIGFSYFLPPGVPAERVAAIRMAFEQMLKDPGFLADAKAAHMYLRPESGTAIDRIVDEVISAKTAVKRRLVSLMTVKGAVACSEYRSSNLCKSQPRRQAVKKATQ